MEEDKKKKKNRRRKNKLNTTTANSAAPPDAVAQSANTTTLIHDDDDDAAAASGLTLEPETPLPKEPLHDVILEHKIQKLLHENDVILQKEATLLEKIEELQNKKVAHMQKEANLEEQILQLKNETHDFMLKMDALGQKIQDMQMEKDALMQKESALEAKVGQLMSEKDSWYHKEACLEEKIDHLTVEAATLSSAKVSLEVMVKQMEEERDSWILQQNSSKEVIAKLNDDNSRLKSQVAELEESRNSLLQENHLLTENISGLQSQILSLDQTAVVPWSSNDGKMVNEMNFELVGEGLQHEISAGEMANFIHIADSTAMGPDLMVGATESQKGEVTASDSMNEASAEMLVPANEVQSEGDGVNYNAKGEAEDFDDKKDMLVSETSEMIKSDEIVQIALDENENKGRGVEATNGAVNTEVALSDAPLIGAPFRLISFVAKYVSGADLVDKKSVSLGR